jgi:phenylalanyl-tRNA synthetase beta chain
LALAEVERILGLQLSPDEVSAILLALEFQVEPASPKRDTLRVTVPDHRMDVGLPADLIEEVARIYGYDRVPRRCSATRYRRRVNLELQAEEQVRDLLVRAGLQRSSLSADDARNEKRSCFPGQPRDPRPYLTITNPISVRAGGHAPQSLG